MMQLDRQWWQWQIVCCCCWWVCWWLADGGGLCLGVYLGLKLQYCRVQHQERDLQLVLVFSCCTLCTTWHSVNYCIHRGWFLQNWDLSELNIHVLLRVFTDYFQVILCTDKQQLLVDKHRLNVAFLTKTVLLRIVNLCVFDVRSQALCPRSDVVTSQNNKSTAQPDSTHPDNITVICHH